MRTGVVIKASVFCLAAAVAAAGLSVAATNTNRRIDLTLARRHQIADRTRARLRALDVPVELVIAVDRSRLDRRDTDRVDDVLAALDAASPNFSVTSIDVTGPEGPGQFERLIERLDARDQSGKAERDALAERTRTDARALLWELTSLDAAATAAAQASADTNAAIATRLGEFAAFARIAKGQLDGLLDTPPDAPGADPAGLTRSIIDAGAALAPQFDAMRTELADMNTPPRARMQASEVARLASTLGERTRAIAETVQPTSDLTRVTEALATGEAALLIGPVRAGGAPGLVALDLDAFFPPPQRAALERTGEAESRVRAEQVVASGLTVLTDDERPIVVFLHGETQRWVGKAGVLSALLDRLAKAGIDYAEWPAVLDDAPPDLAALNPLGSRPVVYAVISPDSAAPSVPGNPQSQPGTARTLRVAEAVEGLIDRGAPVLLGLNPSVFPTFGEADPLGSLVARFGVRVGSNRPILSSANTTLGPRTAWDIRVIPRLTSERTDDDTNPIAVAINGLPVAVEWPLPITQIADAPSASTIDALLTLDMDPAWAESDWLNYWRTPRAERPLLRDPPIFDPPAGDDPVRDTLAARDMRGPFTVAVAIESDRAPSEPPARLVVVGSNTWFLDRVWQSEQEINGRRVLTNPGNPELFDAAVLWLAGRAELIAPSPAARPVARIKPISVGGKSVLRWSLIGGMPIAILGIGGLWRILRG